MPAAGRTAYVGVGSNLADPRAQVERALQSLARLPESRILRSSRLYRSAPWGMLDQPEFVNAAAALETKLSPQALMQALLAIERNAGRERGGGRWGPRILDLDLLLYGSLTLAEPGLQLPHPHLHERAFVLLPLAEIAPHLEVPGRGPISALLASIDTAGCHLIDTA
jgi:2-amino-4-hydroxy-6-hydroxymethyldihydropteridine diphosphokinase